MGELGGAALFGRGMGERRLLGGRKGDYYRKGEYGGRAGEFGITPGIAGGVGTCDLEQRRMSGTVADR